MIKLKFVEIDLNKGKPKATIHQSGKLGFNMEAIEFMKLEGKKSYLLATDEEKQDVFYLVETNESKGAAKVAKAGAYYYLNVADAFDTIGFDYKNYTIMFDISKDTYEGNDLFIFKLKRKIVRKDKQDNEKEESA
jgi:quinol monooxygenase YgiN